ncbi:CatB-related O-acetyltransferase [Pararhizobium arenae]|uniref:CatB-related O-acetyltransferase n=1 Tax=Pararhizobium arenae TaxID=1856850 RepID=UPI000A4AB86C|nr:CatB-related O-acetyltransferase [Pararhizobium arenae]
MPTANLDTGADLHPETVVEWPFRAEGAVRIRVPARIGAYTLIRSSDIAAVGSIGRYCTIGPGFRCGEADYQANWLASSPAFHEQQTFEWALGKYPVRPAPDLLSDPVIGNDVWIGPDVSVTRGVTIGDGAIVTAKAHVTEDVPPYAVVEGAPARVTRYRFAPEVIRVLLAVKWWDFDAFVLQDVPMEAPAKAVAMIMQLEKSGAIRRSPPRHQGLSENARHKADVKSLETLELPSDSLPAARELLDDIERFATQVVLAPLAFVPPPPSDQHIILTSDSGYAGTTAFSSYLSQSNVVQAPFDAVNLSCIRAKHGVLAVLAKPTRETVINFIRACVLGISLEEHPSEAAARQAKQQALASLFRNDAMRTERLLAHARLLLRDAEDGEIVGAVSRFLNSALRIKGNGPFLYWHNLIPQSQINVFPLLENATCIAMTRDVRDQYVSHARASKADPVAIETYVKRRTRQVKEFSAVSHPNIWSVAYEDFVRDDGLRLDLLERLGIPPESINPDKTRFNPAALQKRIGIYKGWADQNAMQQLAEALPSLLHD